MFHMEYIPPPHNKSRRARESRVGRSNGYNWKPNDLGVNYPTGIGCSRCENCFKCPCNECYFQGGGNTNDLHYLSNVGDGIKVW